MDIVKHSQGTQSNKFAISLQYLKKEFRNGVHFLHADKNQCFYKLALLFLMKMARHVQSTQNMRYFMGVQSYSLLLVFKGISPVADVQ